MKNRIALPNLVLNRGMSLKFPYRFLQHSSRRVYKDTFLRACLSYTILKIVAGFSYVYTQRFVGLILLTVINCKRFCRQVGSQEKSVTKHRSLSQFPPSFFRCRVFDNPSHAENYITNTQTEWTVSVEHSNRCTS